MCCVTKSGSSHDKSANPKSGTQRVCIIIFAALNLELLQRQRPTLSLEERSRLTAIREAAERGSGLSHRLLAFSRKQALQPTNVDLNKLVSGMADLIRRTLAESIALETVFGASLSRTFVDQNQLENALLNLVVNAQACHAGRRKTDD